jgi:hypothetical protein
VAGAAGLEPATIGFGDRCSTNWNYAPAKWMLIILTVNGKTRAKVALNENLSQKFMEKQGTMIAAWILLCLFALKLRQLAFYSVFYVVCHCNTTRQSIHHTDR